jgi:hypothetical protein
MIGNAANYVGEPGLRIDIPERDRLNQREHDRGAIGTGEQLCLGLSLQTCKCGRRPPSGRAHQHA